MSDIQRSQWFIVINSPSDKDIYQVNADMDWYLIREVDKWYRIIHDKDIKENGEIKTPHIHVILELKSRVRKTTMLSRLSQYIKVPENCISIEDIRNMSKSVQYLIHKNDQSKYQYSVNDIDTSDKERLNYLLMSDERVSLSTEELFDIIDNARNVRELIKSIGIDMYMKYGRVIDLLWKDKTEHVSLEYVVRDD